MEPADKPIACPWCRSHSLEGITLKTGAYAVRCFACGAQGPAASKPRYAMRKWNKINALRGVNRMAGYLRV